MRETYRDGDAQARRCMRCVYRTLIDVQGGDARVYCPFCACIYSKEGENGCEQRENSQQGTRETL